MQTFPRFFLLLFLPLLVVGCSNTKYNLLTQERFPPKADPAEVRLYVNQVRRPHIKLAHVQSFAEVSRDNDVRRDQLRDIRETAAKVGADAVMEIRQMNNQVRGFVQDERTPFRSYTQDRYQTYFLRGVAIKFVDDERAAAAFSNPLRDAMSTIPPGEGSGDDIPSITTSDPEDGLPMDIVPRGLGPR
ncbi:MAG: hypothetical protein JJU11_11510 [Candidatus Sumerlaeia bacterium]|nr:hypothetical protein [Candidatus Sumerlaeia bacterium]